MLHEQCDFNVSQSDKVRSSMGSRCTYAGAPRAPIEHRCTCKPQLRRRLGAKLGAPTQVHLDASPPGGSCWNAIATAPIGAPAVAGCMRAWIYVWKVYACKYLHLRRCRWTFFGFPCWGKQVQLHSTRCTCIGAPTSHAGTALMHDIPCAKKLQVGV